MYTDFLTRIRNAQAAKKETLKAPFSKMDMAIAELLAKKGYIERAEKKGRMPRRVIEVTLRYKDGVPAIQHVTLLSKSSRRLYAGYRELKKVRQGYGIAVVSTPMGILESMDAKKKKVGGQLLFELW